jgi:hypothetical protein
MQLHIMNGELKNVFNSEWLPAVMSHQDLLIYSDSGTEYVHESSLELLHTLQTLQIYTYYLSDIYIPPMRHTYMMIIYLNFTIYKA